MIMKNKNKKIFHLLFAAFFIFSFSFANKTFAQDYSEYSGGYDTGDEDTTYQAAPEGYDPSGSGTDTYGRSTSDWNEGALQDRQQGGSGSDFGGSSASDFGSGSGANSGSGSAEGWNVESLGVFGIPNSHLRDIIRATMYWILGIFSMIAVIAFAISGIQYLLSAGDEGRMEVAKRHMIYSIVGVVVGLSGLVVVFTIFWALRGFNYF